MTFFLFFGVVEGREGEGRRAGWWSDGGVSHEEDRKVKHRGWRRMDPANC